MAAGPYGDDPGAAPVDLAREGDFSLGGLTIRPSLCEVVARAPARPPVARLQPRIMQVLVVLARAEGAAVSRAELIARCWGGLAVGEDAINRCIARLRRLSEVEAPGAFVIETLPRVGYRLRTAEAAAAPQPQPPAGGAEVRPPPGAAGPRRWTVALGVAAVAVLAIAAVAITAIRLRPAASVRDQRVALAPFLAVGSDPSVPALASGVPDELARALVSADIKPIALQASATAPRDGWSAEARRLGAALLVRGRVETGQGLLHASAALFSLPDQTVLWSSDFARPIREAPSMKVQIAGKIADVLHCALDAGNFRSGRYDRQTFALFLSACDLIHEEDQRDRVGDLLRQVLAREPDFPRAQSMLAISDALAVLPPDQAAAAHREARALAAAALKADPRDGAPYAALYDLEPDRSAFIARYQLLQRGLALSPNDAVLNNRMAELMMQTGFADEAVAYAQRSVNLDRLGPPKAATLAEALIVDGQPNAARTLLTNEAALWPDFVDFTTLRVGLEAREGDPKAALALLADPEVQAAFEDHPKVDDFRRVAQAREAHDPATTAAFTAHMLAESQGGELLAGRAVLMLAAVGAIDAAFQAADRMPPADISGVLLFRPELGGLRADARFMPLAARAGLLAFWRWRRRWPDFCADPTLPYRCAQAAAAAAGL